jgi:hypothetical protein
MLFFYHVAYIGIIGFHCEIVFASVVAIYGMIVWSIYSL